MLPPNSRQCWDFSSQSRRWQPSLVRRLPQRVRGVSIRSFENWKAPDAKTIYIRVNLRQYYRLDLATSCPTLLSANSHLITKWRGSSWVCSALDWDLKVSDDPMRGFASPCIVKTMTPLSESEAASIPRKFKP
jgi:hypothetical protein